MYFEQLKKKRENIVRKIGSKREDSGENKKAFLEFKSIHTLEMCKSNLVVSQSQQVELKQVNYDFTIFTFFPKGVKDYKPLFTLPTKMKKFFFFFLVVFHQEQSTGKQGMTINKFVSFIILLKKINSNQIREIKKENVRIEKELML